MSRCSECGRFSWVMTQKEIKAMVQEFLDLREANPKTTIKQFSEDRGLNSSTVSYHLNKRGINNRTKYDYKDLVERYWVLQASGYHDQPMRVIAEKLGATERAVYRALKAVRYEFSEDEYDYA